MILKPFSIYSPAMEGLGFLDALNSAPVPEIKIKKKKKVLSPTAAKVRNMQSQQSYFLQRWLYILEIN